MTFEEKVRSMTAKEIVQAMIDGLKKPWVKVNMCSFGDFQIEKKWFGLISREVCYGCAATNTICEIAGITFTPENIWSTGHRADAVNATYDFMNGFECAIDYFRMGDIINTNKMFKYLDLPTFPIPSKSLPCLNTENYLIELVHYQKYCDGL